MVLMIADQLANVCAAMQLAAQRRGLAEADGWLAIWSTLGRDHSIPTEDDDTDRPDGDEGEADPLAVIASVFGLRPVEADLLLVAAAPDLDPNVASAYGILLGAPGPQPASVALLLELVGIPLLSGAGRALLGQTAPLRRWGLLHIATGPLNLGRAVTVGEDVVGAIVGLPVPEPVSQAMELDPIDPATLPITGSAAQLSAALVAGTGLCWVEDPAGAAGVATAITAFTQAGIAFTVFDLARRPSGLTLTEAALHAVRRAGLLATALVLSSAEVMVGDENAAEMVDLLARAPIPVVLIGRCRWNPAWLRSLPVVVRAAPLEPEQRIALWREHLTAEQVPADALAPYRLTPEQIAAAGRHVVAQAVLTARPPDRALVAETVRLLGGSGLIRSGFGATRTSYADLQLPPATLASLHRLGDWVRLRDSVISKGQVHGAGGKGTGIAALFTGAPGTGKTLAAHVIADSIGLDLMQVDLVRGARQVHRRDRTESRAGVRGGREPERGPVLRRSRRAIRPPERGQGRERQVRESGGVVSAAANGALQRRHHPGHQPAREPRRCLFPPTAFHHSSSLILTSRPAACCWPNC